MYLTVGQMSRSTLNDQCKFFSKFRKICLNLLYQQLTYKKIVSSNPLHVYKISNHSEVVDVFLRLGEMVWNASHVSLIICVF